MASDKLQMVLSNKTSEFLDEPEGPPNTSLLSQHGTYWDRPTQLMEKQTQSGLYELHT